MNVQRFLLSLLAASTMSVMVGGVPAVAQDGILRASDPQAQINLRQSPDPNSRSLGYGLVGDRVEILEQVPGADDYTWYRVRFYVSGAVGWIRNDFVQLTDVTAPPVSSNARYEDGYNQGYQLGYRDGQNARRYNSGYHPDKFLQAGSGNPDPDYDRGFRTGFLTGFDAGYNTDYGDSLANPNPTSPNSTVLAFQTSSNAVRIFNRSGRTLMNVYNKRDGNTWLNSAPVQIEQTGSGTYYRYQGEVTVLVFQGKDGTRTLEIGGEVETGY